MKVMKKDGTFELFSDEKIIKAITKSANRVMVKLTNEQEKNVVDLVLNSINKNEVTVTELHNLVELALTHVNSDVAESYRSYRNYKNDFVGMLDQVYKKAQSIMYIGDKENSNSDSALVSTKRSLITGELSKELYQKFFLTSDEVKACKDGFIYVHDMRDRLFTMNCCLADVGNVMRGGFEMGNIWYNEPKTLDTACDVLGDIIMSMASQEYGGFTVPHVDTILSYYCEKSFIKHMKEYEEIALHNNGGKQVDYGQKSEWALSKVHRELEQGIQGLEIKLNTVASSRGDYPFTTFTFGNDTNEFAQMVSEVILRTRMNGQGKKGFEKPVLFPKLVFIYDEELHGSKKELELLFDVAIDCSSKTMYPDYLSVSGDGYVPEMYKKYGKVVSPMGL